MSIKWRDSLGFKQIFYVVFCYKYGQKLRNFNY